MQASSNSPGLPTPELSNSSDHSGYHFEEHSVDETVENEESWPYPPEEDLTWYRTHDSMRVDMDEFVRATTALVWRTGKGQMLEEWEKANMSMWWKRFCRTLQAHHDYEEEFLFPWLATRATLPLDRLSQDHDIIIVALEQVTRLMTSVMWSTTPQDSHNSLGKLKAHVLAFQAVCSKHFDDEVEACVPIMRKHFSHQEAKEVIHDTLNRTMTTEDIAEILRPMNKEERRRFLKQENVSGLRARFVFNPACKRYDRVYTAALRDVIRGQQSQPKGITGTLKKLLSGKKSGSSSGGSSAGSIQSSTMSLSPHSSGSVALGSHKGSPRDVYRQAYCETGSLSSLSRSQLRQGQSSTSDHQSDVSSQQRVQAV